MGGTVPVYKFPKSGAVRTSRQIPPQIPRLTVDVPKSRLDARRAGVRITLINTPSRSASSLTKQLLGSYRFLMTAQSLSHAVSLRQRRCVGTRECTGKQGATYRCWHGPALSVWVPMFPSVPEVCDAQASANLMMSRCSSSASGIVPSARHRH